MMKVFLDTNVMLDFLLKREDVFEDAHTIMALGYHKHCELFMSSLSFANIAYIARKELKGEALYDCFSSIRELLTISPVSEVEVDQAILLRADDFEDALQYCSAKTIEADCMVTRNIKDFPFSQIEILTPPEFVQRMKPDQSK